MTDQFTKHSQPVQRMIDTHTRIAPILTDNPGLVLSIQISEMGPFVYGRKDQLSCTHIASWLELDRSRVNPLDLALDRVLRDLSVQPKEPN